MSIIDKSLVQQVVTLKVLGKPDSQIAWKLGVPEATVRYIMREFNELFDKFKDDKEEKDGE